MEHSKGTADIQSELARSKVGVAIKTNNATAQYNLGFRYLNGDGVTADDLEGRKWLQAAAKQGHAAASRTLKELGPVPVATTNRPAARAPVKP